MFRLPEITARWQRYAPIRWIWIFPQVIVEDTRKALRDVAAAYKETMNCKTVAITGSVGKTTTGDQ